METKDYINNNGLSSLVEELSEKNYNKLYNFSDINENKLNNTIINTVYIDTIINIAEAAFMFDKKYNVSILGNDMNIYQKIKLINESKIKNKDKNVLKDHLIIEYLNIQFECDNKPLSDNIISHRDLMFKYPLVPINNDNDINYEVERLKDVIEYLFNNKIHSIGIYDFNDMYRDFDDINIINFFKEMKKEQNILKKNEFKDIYNYNKIENAKILFFEYGRFDVSISLYNKLIKMFYTNKKNNYYNKKNIF